LKDFIEIKKQKFELLILLWKDEAKRIAKSLKLSGTRKNHVLAKRIANISLNKRNKILQDVYTQLYLIYKEKYKEWKNMIEKVTDNEKYISPENPNLSPKSPPLSKNYGQKGMIILSKPTFIFLPKRHQIEKIIIESVSDLNK